MSKNTKSSDWDTFLEEYLKWYDFLNTEVTFSMSESKLHTLGHVRRVLLFSLLLAREMDLTESEREALAIAACFHDTRRENDRLDTGHGDRAAEYYRSFSSKNPLPFDERSYYAIKYHDRDDTIGLSEIEKAFPDDSSAILLYQVFKDADALDRFRLGEKGLDEKFLRTDAARRTVDFARKFYEMEFYRIFDE